MALITAIFIAVTACGGSKKTIEPENKPIFTETAMSLDNWLNKIVGPQLSKTISEYPMFNNEPFLIATICDEEIRPIHDDSTKNIT